MCKVNDVEAAKVAKVAEIFAQSGDLTVENVGASSSAAAKVIFWCIHWHKAADATLKLKALG